MELRPLEFNETNKFSTFGEAATGTYFRFKNKKTVYRIDKNDGLYVTVSMKVNDSENVNLKDIYQGRAQGDREIQIMLPKKPKVLMSFSAGETSAYLAWTLMQEKSKEWEIINVFANVGLEDEKTLEFAQRCEGYLGLKIQWIEAVINPERGKGIGFKIVDFKTAERSVRIFREAVAKYGLFNKAQPNCSKYLKARAIKTYAKSIGWNKYYTAIGIRADEIDRMSVDRHKLHLIYPFISYKSITKKHVNFWWSLQDFRLELKGYQGNCKTCWKKSDRKLTQIAAENPEYFKDFDALEKEFGYYIPEGRDPDKQRHLPITMFRGHKSAQYYLEAAKTWDSSILDDHQDMPDEDDESCEVFSNCGVDN